MPDTSSRCRLPGHRHGPPVRHRAARPRRRRARKGWLHRTGDHPRTGRARHLRRHHARAMGRLGDRSGDLRAAAGGDRRRRRLRLHHGERAQLPHLHHLRPLRHRRAERPLAAPARDRCLGRFLRADRAAGRLRCIEPEDPRGEKGRPLHHQRRQAVHLLREQPRRHGAVRRHRSAAPAARASPASSWTRRPKATWSRARRKSSARRRPRPARFPSRTWKCPRTSASARKARATASHSPRWRAAASASPRRASAWRAPPWTYAVAYAKERQAFGGRIIDFQAVGFRLVDAKTKLEAARQLTLHAARLKTEGQPVAGSGLHGEAVRDARWPRRCAQRRSRRWAATAISPTIRSSASIATCACARSTKARRMCRS